MCIQLLHIYKVDFTVMPLENIMLQYTFKDLSKVTGNLFCRSTFFHYLTPIFHGCTHPFTCNALIFNVGFQIFVVSRIRQGALSAPRRLVTNSMSALYWKDELFAFFFALFAPWMFCMLIRFTSEKSLFYL